jgi:hypothetical protein
VEDLRSGTIFFIWTSPESKWISNEKSVKFLGLEFARVSFWNFKFG